MASIQKHGKRWRVQVYADGVRDSRVCDTRQQAAFWALQREGELTGKRLPDKTLADAMRHYRDEVSPAHRGHRWESVRLRSMERDPLARRKLAGLSDEDFIAWRDARLKQVAPGTVARELNLLRSVLETARKAPLKWIRANPLEDVDWPQCPKGRARRVTDAELASVVSAFKVEPLCAQTATQRVGLAFLFAIETAMRSGEIVGLTWPDVHLSARYVVLPVTKNGDRREVPLSSRAVAILRTLPEGEGAVFGLDAANRDALWRKTRPVPDLHFHDSRGEAVWRLSKKFDVLQLARVVGHRDPRSLMAYYRESAADLAKHLD